MHLQAASSIKPLDGIKVLYCQQTGAARGSLAGAKASVTLRTAQHAMCEDVGLPDRVRPGLTEPLAHSWMLM
jgi:hypothetical protein